MAFFKKTKRAVSPFSLLKKRAGFTLLELMITVAIIGILAAIALPNYRNFQLKAKQSEGRTLLGQYFSANIIFFQEYNVFYPDFRNIGFHPTGDLRYLLGLAPFQGDGEKHRVPSGYTGPGQQAGATTGGSWVQYWNTQGYCNLTSSCTNRSNLNFLGNFVPPETYDTYHLKANQQGFLAVARSNFDEDPIIDKFTINEKKQIFHLVSD